MHIVDGKAMTASEYRKYRLEQDKAFDEELDREINRRCGATSYLPGKELERINESAREEGLTYGQYVAKYHLYSTTHIVTAAEKEKLAKKKH